MSLTEHVGQRVRELRTERGLSQRDIGRLLGVSHVAVCNLERAATGVTLERIGGYAAALGVEPWELLHGYDPEGGDCG